MFEKKADHFLHHHGLDLKNKGVVIGVSGGPDSLALLHYFISRRDRWNLSIAAVHVDHMFRGEESYNEAMFVKDFCDKYGIPCEIKRIDVPAYIKNSKKNPQEASRECRYQFFYEIMERYQYPFLALGHHGDDQVETILMRLTRGSTGKARAGISFKRPFYNGQIIRPFLCFTRDDIEQYCTHHQLDPRRDPSNDKDIYSRNRYRKKLLPFLKMENPNVHEHFQRFSEELQSDEELLLELTLQKMNKVMQKNDDKIAVDIKKFTAMPIPLQRRGIQLILKYLYKERLSSASAIHIDQLFLLIRNSKASGMLDFPFGLQIIRSYNELYFSFKKEAAASYRFEIKGPGSVKLPNGNEILVRFNETDSVKPDLNQVLLDCRDVSLPIIIRTRKDGDRMSIKGMEGTKKVKEIFIDKKIPIHKRNEWPIVTDSRDNILWVPGIKQANLKQEDQLTDSYIHLIYRCNESSRGQL